MVWGANPDEPLIDYTPAAGKHYYHSDVQGNTITVTDASLNTLERYRYDAYGNVTFWAWSRAQRPQSTAGTKYRFTGQEYVPALGLHNYKNRMYASEIGRFLQSDPKRLDGGDLNLYRYCRNNPFNGTDPLGMEEKKGAVGTAGTDITDVFASVQNWLGTALNTKSSYWNSGTRAQGAEGPNNAAREQGNFTRVGTVVDRTEIGEVNPGGGRFLQWTDATKTVDSVGLFGQVTTVRAIGLYGTYTTHKVQWSGFYRNPVSGAVQIRPEAEFLERTLTSTTTRATMDKTYSHFLATHADANLSIPVRPEHQVGHTTIHGFRRLDQ